MVKWQVALSIALVLATGSVTQAADEDHPAQFIADIQYSETPGADPVRQQLDISIPPGEGPFPVVMHIHGGAWSGGQKSRQKFAAKRMNSEGYIYASINYRLSPAHIHPAHIEDCASAFAYLYNHAKEYRIDTGNMFVMGHSVGAQLAALLAGDGRWLGQHGIPLEAINGAVCLDTVVYDLVYQQTEYPVLKFTKKIEQAFTSDREMQLDASPAVQIVADEDVGPFLIVYADNGTYSREMSLYFQEVLDELGIWAAVLPMEGKTHMAISWEFGLIGNQTTQAVLDFLDARLAGTFPSYD